jgi:hypothetical protein
MGSPAISVPGTSQFGINLVANTNPSVGNNVTGYGPGLVTASYNAPNYFVFNNGDIIAESPAVSNYNKYTISYLVNIDPKQPEGVYATTVNLIATGNF